jgi:hypothetical protein
VRRDPDLPAGVLFRRVTKPALQATGNAVPVKFAQAIAEHLKQHMERQLPMGLEETGGVMVDTTPLVMRLWRMAKVK